MFVPLEAQVLGARPWPKPPLNEPVLEKIVGQSECCEPDDFEWCAGYL